MQRHVSLMGVAVGSVCSDVDGEFVGRSFCSGDGSGFVSTRTEEAAEDFVLECAIRAGYEMRHVRAYLAAKAAERTD